MNCPNCKEDLASTFDPIYEGTYECSFCFIKINKYFIHKYILYNGKNYRISFKNNIDEVRLSYWMYNNLYKTSYWAGGVVIGKIKDIPYSINADMLEKILLLI